MRTENWLIILDQLEALQPRKIVPGHGEVGDATLVSKERTYLKEIQSRAVELKAQGKNCEDASDY